MGAVFLFYSPKIPLKLGVTSLKGIFAYVLYYLKNRPTTGNRAPSFLLSPFSTIMIAT